MPEKKECPFCKSSHNRKYGVNRRRGKFAKCEKVLIFCHGQIISKFAPLRQI